MKRDSSEARAPPPVTNCLRLGVAKPTGGKWPRPRPTPTKNDISEDSRWSVLSRPLRPRPAGKPVSQPPDVSELLGQPAPGAVGVVEPALGEHHAARDALPAARRAEVGGRERLGRVELGQQPVEVVQGVDQPEGAAQLTAGGEALEVPRHVLAELPAARAPPPCARRAARRDGASSPPPPRASAGSRPRSPAKAAARSRKSQGRPRQPRPTTTPAAPVCSTIRSASAASQMSPLPRTGMSTCCGELADGVPVGRARSRPGRRCGRAARSRRTPDSWAIRPASR